jgi:hypothetical protein
MLIYLDNCSFNRPFNDQKQIRIRIETEAKLYIQENIVSGTFKLAWSYLYSGIRYTGFQQLSIEKFNAILNIDFH